MAEKKKYNSILISGRKDETLTYSRYVKDEESGESVKETLDKKVNVSDELETQQIKNGAITNEKLAADSVGNGNIQDSSVSNEKLEDRSVTNEKLAENSITKDKLQDKTIGVEKLDNELRQTIAAATGLPEDLVETIQNVDDTLKDHQSQLDDKQSQIDDKQQQITANDEDISLLQTRSTQMEETIKGIAATGGASQATAVTYNNEKSKLTAVNIQSAVDEVVDKASIKDDEGTVVDTPFRYIQNEDFIFAKVDAEDKLLFGIHWDGTPEFGKTSAVEDRLQSQVTLLAEKVATIMGDEDTTNVIDTMNELKKFFAEIDNTQTLTSILANLKELLDVFSLQDNEEYLAVEQDAEGKVLSATNPDGSHYIHNAKSETIPTEFSHIEDPEGRTEITTDAQGKLLGYRDSEGTRHEHKISVNHLELSDEAATEVSKAFKSAGIKMENPSDFSKDSHIELPIPRIAAQVRLYATKLPTTKQDDIYAEIEYNDKDGNYFRKLVILNAQGDSSLVFAVKNMAIDIADGSEIKFGDFPAQDSFHLKKYYIDAFRGQCIVGYWLIEQMYKSRPIGQQYPYEYNYSNDSTTEGLGSPKKDFFTGAKCHPDGFPIVITWVNPVTKEETNMGIYTWNLKKSKEVYNAEKKKAENIILDGVVAYDTLFGGTINWSAFEIRNPKNLIDINGNKYNGDKPIELSNSDKLSKQVKDYLIRFSKSGEKISNSKTKEVFEQYFLVNPFIDYFLFSDLTYNFDGLRKNWIWLAYDGNRFTPSVYDVDSIFGSHYTGLYVTNNSCTDTELVKKRYPCNILYDLYKDAIEARYSELRKLGIFTVENISQLLDKWITSVGYDNYVSEFALYAETPSYRANNINEGWKFLGWAGDINNTYDGSKLYAEGETCIFYKCKFEATKNISGVEPAKVYKQYPFCMGMYNSKTRVLNWIAKRIETLDIFYNYK